VVLPRRSLLLPSVLVALPAAVVLALIVTRVVRPPDPPGAAVRRYRLVSGADRAAPERLAAAARAVEARAACLSLEPGHPSVSCRTTAPDVLEVRVAGSSDLDGELTWLTRPGRVQFRLGHPERETVPSRDDETLGPAHEALPYSDARYRLSPPREVERVETLYALERESVLEVGAFEEVECYTTGVERLSVLVLRFEERDAAAFARLTALHAGRRMAMLVDGELFFPPRTIESAVVAGAVQIEGYYHMPSMRRLACLLRSGPMPVTLRELPP
jgi:hypothetical protein